MPLKLFFVLYAAQKQNGTSKRLAIHGAFPRLLSFRLKESFGVSVVDIHWPYCHTPT